MPLYTAKSGEPLPSVRDHLREQAAFATDSIKELEARRATRIAEADAYDAEILRLREWRHRVEAAIERLGADA